MKKNTLYILILFLLLAMFTLFACYLFEKYTVTFQNEEGEVYQTVVVIEGEKIIKPEDPSKEGYTFLNWVYNGENWIFSDYTVSDNMTLTAKFLINKYTITFDTDGGTTIETITDYYQNPIVKPEDPTREGYIFMGWEPEIPANMPSMDMTIKAIWYRPIMLGCVGPLSGAASMYGQMVKKGIELAVEEINKAGGVNVNGVMTEIQIADFIDDQMDFSKAANALKTLMNSNVDMVIGAVSSAATEGLISEAIKYDVPVISPSGTADQLTVGQEGNEREERYNIFRACNNDSYQAKYMAQYAKQAGYNKVYVLYNNEEDYSNSLKDEFILEAKSQGIEVVVGEYNDSERDFSSLWTSIINEGYQCVYIPDYYYNVYNVLKAGYTKGYQGVCYGSDGWDGLIYEIRSTDDYKFLEKCFYTSPFHSASESETVKKFVEAYKNKYNEIPSAFAAYGYDAIYIAKQAIEKAGSTEYDKVIEALTNSTFKGLVTTNKDIKFVNGNPESNPFIITFKDGKEVEAK